MLTAPIVEGAYYEREDGMFLGPAVRDQGVWRVGPHLFWSDGAQLNQSHRLNRRVYLVPTDPSEVVAELRERSESEWHSDETATRAYSEAAELVAAKLGVKS